MIVARFEATGLIMAIEQESRGELVYLRDGANLFKRLIRGAYELRENRSSTVPEFFGFRDWDEFQAGALAGGSRELKVFVAFVATYGLGGLWHRVKHLDDTDRTAAIHVLETRYVHGQRWDVVRLADDFADWTASGADLTPELSADAARHLYIAATRARRSLQIGESTERMLR